MSPQFRLKTLGGAALEGPSGALAGRAVQPRSLALLALLGVGPGIASRDKLLGYLWPDTDRARGRHLLSNVLYHLRQQLGEEAVIGAGDTLRLNKELVSVDVDEFLHALSHADLVRSENLYGGPFLDGFYLSEAPEFERWVERERDRLARAFAAALDSSARQCESAGDHAGAALRLARLAETDPYNSRVAARLARSLRAAGDPAGALRELENHSARLRADLGLDPPPELAALVGELRPPAMKPSPPPAVRRSRNGNGSNGLPATPPAGRESVDPALRGALRHHWRRLAAAALLGVPLLLLLGLWNRLSLPVDQQIAREVSATHPRMAQLLIADFDAPASEAALGSLVTEALRADFEGSARIAAYPAGEGREALRRMELPPETAISGSVARELAIREGLPLSLEGEIHESGGAYVLTARLVAIPDGATLGAFRATAQSRRQLIPAIDRLSKRIRTTIGESAQQVRASARLDDVTTASLEALQSYSLARRALREGNQSAASLLLEQAVAQDSTFAMAHHYLAMTRATAFDDARAAVARTQAFRHRHKLPPYERYRIEGGYWWQEGEPERAAAAWEAALEIRPRDVGMLNNLAAYYGARDQARFSTMAARAYAEDRGAPPSVVNYAVALFRQEKFDSARRVLHSLPSPPPGMAITEGNMLIALGQYDAAERVLLGAWREAEGKPGRHMNVAWTLAGLTAIIGRLSESIAWMEEVQKSPALSRSDSLRVETVIARLLAFVGGDTALARRRLSHALARFPPASISVKSRPLLDIAHTYVALGLFENARLTLREYEDSIPRPLRWRQRMYHAHVTGAVALAESDFPNAARAFRISGREGCSWCEDFGMAQLHILQLRPDSAIARLERFLAAIDPFRWGDDSWWLAGALERLAQLYDSKGDREKAAGYYERFARLWAAADAPLQPRVRRAQSASEWLRQEHLATITASPAASVNGRPAPQPRGR